ncbi:hypothetical protein FDUTEX481_04522 [Tolypothrix sp. PCC 7601]|nr:hypothetical protein FDUTEX481_04522 [Tolypothrix sp. PCC 7601]
MPSWFIGCLSPVSVAVVVGFGVWLWFWEAVVEQAVKKLLGTEAIATKVNDKKLFFRVESCIGFI